MHEFGVTERLFQVALDQANLADGERICRLQVALDPDSGYLPDAIRFYFEQLAKGTPAEGAELDFSAAAEPRRIALTALDIEYGPESIEAPELLARWRLQIQGVVQGVGFRPFVHNLAHSLGLSGWVCNSSGGVEMELQGLASELDHFLHHLKQDAPPLAQIVAVAKEVIPLCHARESGLEIRSSHSQSGRTLISPDMATCPHCVQEIFDPVDQRYRYPFTNCTHCGPHFTIIKDLPYDRLLTTMAAFSLCPSCEAEYGNPADRRFHAQPVACPICGPTLSYWMNDFADGVWREVGQKEEALEAAITCLNQNGVIGVKGLGGFHLACRIDGEVAINRLRISKGRWHKPLALMVRNVREAAALCHLNTAEETLLLSPEAPMVLLRKRQERRLAPLYQAISPDNGYLGVMLPYTPLHHLLLQQVGVALVMTSGNRHGEPICINNEEAKANLQELCDGLLLHTRPIVRRCDDSVVFVTDPGDELDKTLLTQPIRRSRGLAPLPVLLPEAISGDAAMVIAGADMKNVSAVCDGRQVFLTQHLGELSHPAARAAQAETIATFERLFKVQPQVVVCDMHPDYASSAYARRRESADALPLIEVQHHHAHIAACLAENQVTDKAIGLSFDGTGYGPDGRIWGGEVLLADLCSYERAFHLEYLPLPGGDAATHNPPRIAAAYLYTLLPEADIQSLLPDLPLQESALIKTMISQDVNCPLTSSMGRLFDAVSALLGLCAIATHEAQAAIALEHAALQSYYDGVSYPFLIEAGQIKVGPLLKALVADLQVGAPVADIARRFHITIAEMSLAAGDALRTRSGIEQVALSGGVWQNRLLLTLTVTKLRQAGFEVLLHRVVPANDGGLAYGQAAVAAAQLKESMALKRERSA